MEVKALTGTGTGTTDSQSTKKGFFSFPASSRHASHGWRLIPLLVAALVLIPVGTVVSSLFTPAGEVWRHLAETTLPDLLANTFWLTLGVLAGVTLLGVSLAWFTGVCEFPGRQFFSWALLLPFAMPAYVTAFVALGLFDYIGPIQTALREWFGAGIRPSEPSLASSGPWHERQRSFDSGESTSNG